jgi:hypothetical protein
MKTYQQDGKWYVELVGGLFSGQKLGPFLIQPIAVAIWSKWGTCPHTRGTTRSVFTRFVATAAGGPTGYTKADFTARAYGWAAGGGDSWDEEWEETSDAMPPSLDEPLAPGESLIWTQTSLVPCISCSGELEPGYYCWLNLGECARLAQYASTGTVQPAGKE